MGPGLKCTIGNWLSGFAAHMWRDPYERRQLTDTAFRGGLAVALYIVFPAFSDVHRLWERAAGLNRSWPQGAFEYPPISALYFQPLSLLPSSRWAVAINGLLMVAAAIGVTWLLIRMAGSTFDGVDVRMWVASPALLLLLPINWDVLVVLVSVLGVVALYKSRTAVSGLWHGVGTALKVFPGAVVLPALPLVEGWRRRVVFLASGFTVLALSYIGYMAIDPGGWRFHLDFASTRTDTESTIWGLLDGLLRLLGDGLSIGAINIMSTVSIVVALLLLTVWVAKARPTVAEVAVLALTVLLILNKTFKPQYVLWVLPFYAWLGVNKLKVRSVETAAIVAFVVVYFDVPRWINPVETVIRVTLLIVLAAAIIKSRAGQSTIRTSGLLRS